MLTADLVTARRRGDRLVLIRPDGEQRERALELAGALVEVTRAAVGDRRSAVEEAWAEIPCGARDRRLRDGLRKLVDDRCTFAGRDDEDPVALRAEVFARASAARAALGYKDRFDRQAVLEAVAAERGETAAAVDEALFSDLKDARRLEAFEACDAEALLAQYEHGLAQAVLLRATRVVVRIDEADPAAWRALFRRLKFLRLLFTLERGEGGGFVITIDGPLNLFSASTRYGLQLAMLLPQLDLCSAWRLQAAVQWGPQRAPLIFELEGPRGGAVATGKARLADDVAALKKKLNALGGRWRAATSRALLDLPGVGVCVPDLRCKREDGAVVHLEVMGYWSREAVWRRVELVEAGMKRPVLFAVSERLRVSEEALPEEGSAGLYVYKGVMDARRVVEKLEALAER